MKSMSISKLAKIANKIAKSSNRAPLYYFCQNNDVFTVFTPYFAVRFQGVERFNEIATRVGHDNIKEGEGAIIVNINKMFNDLNGDLFNSNILAEDNGGTIRFLYNADRVVAVNEAYFEIFDPVAIYSSQRDWGPAVLSCSDCIAAILPVKAQNKSCVANMKQLAKLYS